MKKILLMTACCGLMMGATVSATSADAADDSHSLWLNADRVFNNQPDQEKQSSFNSKLKAAGWIFRMAASLSAGGFAGYKLHEYLNEKTSAETGSWAKTAVGWTGKLSNPTVNFAMEKAKWARTAIMQKASVSQTSSIESQAVSSSSEQPVPTQVVVTPNHINLTLSVLAGFGVSKFVHTFLSDLLSGFDRNRCIDLKVIRTAIKLNLDPKNRNWIRTLPLAVQRTLQQATGNESAREALALLHTIRGQIEYYFSSGFIRSPEQFIQDAPVRRSPVVVR